MKIFASLPLLAILATSAFAQQLPSRYPEQDPQVAVYRQLLDEANARIAATSAQAQTKITDLQKQLDAAKSSTSAPSAAEK